MVTSAGVWTLAALTAVVLGSAIAGAARVALPRWFAVLAGVAAAVLALRRETWLPFLGETVLPPGVFRKTFGPTRDTTDVDVLASPGAIRVAYWASESADSSDPRSAYGDYKNSGVAGVSADGSATLRLRCPGLYRVRGGYRPSRHAHYREVFANGTLGPVKTVRVDCIP